MLERMRLINFRCFRDFTIEFDKFNIIVGKNNSGKSTIIDALKLISNVIRYAPYRNRYLEERDIPFSTINLKYNYNDEESVISVKFTDTTEIDVIFPAEGRPYANLLKNGKTTKDKLAREKIMGIIPPVGAFDEMEKIGEKEYVRSKMISHLTPRHFREIWHYFPEGFEEFKELIEKTWPGYSIDIPEIHLTEDNKMYIDMYYTEDRISREIFWAGHGFQIWLQLMTFLVKLGPKETLVLDEPDIYLHQDLQKKLVNTCKERANQVIIATHAVDIIEEVEPEDIISIDKSLNISKRLSTVDEVQTCINQLGSYQNLKLVNFIRGKTCLFVEGKDFNSLKKFAKKLEIYQFAQEDGFSVIPLDGFSNWEKLIHIDWLFENAFGEKVRCYVLLDRDYYSDDYINYVVNNLSLKGVKIHVWSKKELENFLINFELLFRIFSDEYRNRYPNQEIPLSSKDFENELISLFDPFKSYVQGQMISKILEVRTDKKIITDNREDISAVTIKTLEEFEISWSDIEYRKKVIPGKDYFSRMNRWLNEKYKISISLAKIKNSLLKEEIDTEIVYSINDFMTLIKSNP